MSVGTENNFSTGLKKHDTIMLLVCSLQDTDCIKRLSGVTNYITKHRFVRQRTVWEGGYTGGGRREGGDCGTEALLVATPTPILHGQKLFLSFSLV